MLAREKPDLVDICTPPRTHAKLAVQAIEARCHVLIEKPMAMDVAECDTIIDAAREAGVKICVAHSDLFYYPFMKARELVARGHIGEFRGLRILLSTPTDYMTARPDHWAHKLPGGVVGETGPHVVYITLAFIPKIEEITVQAKKLLNFPWSAFEDYRIELVGEKAVSSIALSYATNQWMATVDILGSTGGLLVDLQGLALVKYDRRSLRPLTIAGSMLSGAVQNMASTCVNGLRYVTGQLRTTHAILLDRFIRSICQNGPVPVSANEGREAVRVLSIIADELASPAHMPVGAV
jgi:predicted dehydrogenase